MNNKKSILIIFFVLIFLSISAVQAGEIDEISDIDDVDDSVQLTDSIGHNNTYNPVLKDKLIIPTFISVTNNNTDFKSNQSNYLNISLTDINKVGLENREIIIIINDTIISTKITDANGNAYLNLDYLDYGEYSVTYSYNGDDDHSSCINTTKFTISRFIPQTVVTYISAQSLTIKQGSAGTFVITLSDINGTVLPNQKVIVDIDGDVGVWYTDTEGQVNILFYPDPSDINKTFNISFYFEGKDQYYPSNGSSFVSVVDANAILTRIFAYDLNLTVTDTEDFIIKLIDENGDPIPYQRVYIDFNNDKDFWYTDENGEIGVLLYEMKEGIYPITYTYYGEGNYSPAMGSNIITVTNPNGTGTKISGQDMILSIGDIEVFIIKLTTAKGDPVPNQTVNINFLTSLTKVTDEDGQVEIILYELSNGTYNINYSFEGKGIYLPSNGSNTIIVNSEIPEVLNTTISGNNITMNLSETKNITVTLRDSNNQVLSDQTVYFVFRNVTTRQITNTRGQATIVFSDLPVGNYTLNYYFNGTNRYERSENYNTITVYNGTVPPEPPSGDKIKTQFFSSDITAFEGNTVNFITILTDSQGLLLSGKTIKFTFRGTEINITTDNMGQANLTLYNLTEGVYIVSFEFAGDNNYTESYGANTITIKSNSTEGNITSVIISDNLIKNYGSDEDFKGELVDLDGNPIVGQHISIILTRLSTGASKVYDVVSNYLGEFVLPINLATGNYVAEIDYKGITMFNKTYSPASATNTITVVENRTETVLTATRFSEPYNANKSFNGTLTDVYGNALAGHTVYVTLSRLSTGANKTYATTVNYLGYYNLDINLAVGEYFANCSYDGTTIYLPSDASNTVTVY